MADPRPSNAGDRVNGLPINVFESLEAVLAQRFETQAKAAEGVDASPSVAATVIAAAIRRLSLPGQAEAGNVGQLLQPRLPAAT